MSRRQIRLFFAQLWCDFWREISNEPSLVPGVIAAHYFNAINV
jgi:hypothetical protein